MNFTDTPLLYLVGHTLMRGAAESFFSVKVLHRERLIENGPCVIVANHQSFLDPPMVGQLYSNKVYFLARKTLFEHPIFGSIIRQCNAFPVDQDRPDPGSLLKLLRLVRSGERVVIFPEGSRSEDGLIHEAMPGIGFILSKLTSVPVQPIRIEGAFDCLPIHSNRLKFRPITLSVGEPIHFTQAELNARGREAQQALAHKVMESIRALPVTC